MSRARRQHGFSLVEILVSITIMAFLLLVGTQAFVQVVTMTKRIQARQELHNTARIIVERMQLDLGALQQTAALYLLSHDGSGSEPQGVELIFLRGKLDLTDFTRHDGFGISEPAITDLVWSRWAWQTANRTLSVAASSRTRLFKLSNDWMNGTINYRNQYFANLPTPRRVAGAGPATLDANAYGTGDPNDIGDYQDLIANAIPLSTTCTGLRIELVLHNGSTITVDGSNAVAHAIDGVRVDSRIIAANALRPRLVRFLIDLQHDETQLTETFSFSTQTTGLLPP